MKSLNEWRGVGHVGQDPELRVTKTGKAVVNLSVATNGRADKDGNQRVSWHRIVLWERLAMLAKEYVRKGDPIMVTGRLEYGSYEKDGVQIPTAEIVAHDIILLSSRTKEEDGQEAEAEVEDDVLAGQEA